MRHDSDGICSKIIYYHGPFTNYVERGVGLARTFGYNRIYMQFAHELR